MVLVPESVYRLVRVCSSAQASKLAPAYWLGQEYQSAPVSLTLQESRQFQALMQQVRLLQVLALPAVMVK